MGNVLVKVRGLHTYPSEVSQVPDGAMFVADNVVIDRESVVEQRPGFNNYATVAGDSRQLLQYKDRLLVSYIDGSDAGQLDYDDGTGTLTQYSGSFDEPDFNDSYVPRLKGAELNSNFYITTDFGLTKLEALVTTPTIAGMPRGLDMLLALSGASGFMDNDTQVAYRHVWARRDVNNNLILGAPSQRNTISNSTGGSRDISVSVTIPDEITVNDFLQVYRSALSVDANTEPNDELGLVYEVHPTSTEITAKVISFTDNTTDDLRGATIYTAASQEGISQANDQPPRAKDVAVFKNCMFLANTQTKSSVDITLLSASGDSGINYRAITGDTTSGTDTILNASATTGLAIGQSIIGIGVAAGTTITNISGTTITISANASATNVGTALECSDTITIATTDVYSAYALERSTGTVSITAASPAVVTWTANGLQNGSTVVFGPTGSIPTGISFGTTYYVVNVAANTFEIALTYGGASINTTGSGGSTPAVANNLRFQVVSGGTPSQNIADTALSLVRVINKNTSNTNAYAYYLSGASDLPGQILLERKSFDYVTQDFSVIASSHGSAWNPVLPTSGTTVSSSSEALSNAIYISKVQRPEAYPALQFLRVGATDEPIQRILPLRESLIIMKTDGVYRLTGDTPANFTVDILDNTVFVSAPETAVTLNNQIYAFTNQGVCTISDTGVAVISRPIEDKLRSLPLITNFESISFAASYETSHKYILFLPTVAADTYATQQFVFNVFTGAWTRWTRDGTCSLNLKSDDKLYFGSASVAKILQERKTNSYTDYCDETVAITISAVNDDVVTLSSISGLSVGDAIVQGSIPFATITEIDSVAVTVTVFPERPFTAAAANAYKRIDSTVQWAPQYMGFPGIMKQVRDFTILTKDRRFREALLTFSSNLSRDEVDVVLTGFSSFLWGYFAWGSIPWGGGNPPDRLRTYIPTESQHCDWLVVQFSHSQAYQAFGIEGFTLAFNQLSEMTGF